MASKDIFSRNVSDVKGVFTTDNGKLRILGENANTNLGVLVQSLNFSYTQNVTRLYEVGANGTNGENFVYFVGGRTQGNLAINRVVGPSGTVQELYTKYGNVCNARSNSVSLELTNQDCSGGAATAKPATYTMKGCVIVSVAVGVQSQDMVIGENTTMMFATMVNGFDQAAQAGVAASNAIFGGVGRLL